MLILGLTGDIACGKSTVARMLKARGAAVIDADLLVRELYADTAFARRVAALFEDGEKPGQAPSTRASLLLPDGSVNRKALGALVFADGEALRRLESLVHPAVAKLRERKIEELRRAPSPPPAIVLEAVKLIESGAARRCDLVWWITSDPALQLQRLMKERGLSEDAARRRLANQPSHAGRRSLLGATPCVVIENNGTLRQLQQRVEEEWQEAASARR